MASPDVDADLHSSIFLSELNEVDVKSFTGHEDDVSSSCYDSSHYNDCISDSLNFITVY